MIPLEQGSVFRLRRFCNNAINLPSQSLWNRAVSSDDVSDLYLANWRASQSLWNRAVSSDITPLLMLVIVVYVSIPLEQGSVFRRLVNYQAV